MKGYKTILVPVDGSDNAKRALEQASMLAQLCDAELVLAHVVDIIAAVSNFDQILISGDYISQQIAEEMVGEGHEVLDKVVKELDSAVKCKTVFEVGSPAPTILDIADKHQADLIVMGSRGLGQLKGFVLGSISSYITTHAKCPVMVVR